MNRTTDLTQAERLLLLTTTEPFVFMPDGPLEPLSSQRMRDLWWTAAADVATRELEPA